MTRKTINPELLFANTQPIAEVQSEEAIDSRLETFQTPLTNAVNHLIENEVKPPLSNETVDVRPKVYEAETEQIEVIQPQDDDFSSVFGAETVDDTDVSGEKSAAKASSKNKSPRKLISRRNFLLSLAAVELAALTGHSVSQQRESLIGKRDKDFKQAEMTAIKNLADDHVRIAKNVGNLITGKYGE